MKRSVFLVLLCACLILSGCASSGLIETNTAESADAETALANTSAQGSSEETMEYPTISSPLTRADLEALPVATPEMSEDQLRQLCISYMEMMTGVVWTADQSLSYSYPSAFAADDNGMLNLLSGNLYGGVPYTQAAGNLEAFFDYYDENTGVLAISRMNGNIDQKVGNNCGTAVFWAWQRVSSTISYYGTRQMNLSHGCIPVGSYTYDGSIENYYAISTKQICEDNGKDVMVASYAQLKPGDGVTMTVKGIGGHARMVKEIEVVRDAAGKVDPDKSYVICLEQASGGGTREIEDGMVHNIGSENKYSFTNLYQKYYLPVTIAELCGRATVQKGEAALPACQTLQELSDATLHGSYCIARVDVIVSDQNGEVFTATKMGSCKTEDQYDFSMSKAIPPATLSRNLKKGESYTVTVEARLGNGESVTAFSGTLLY